MSTDPSPAPRRSGRNRPSHQQFQVYKSKGKVVLNIMDLLPGLNDILDAFEALPLDIVKYFTLLKEIDAKCINTVPQINTLIERYVADLHRNGTVDDGLSEGTEQGSEPATEASEQAGGAADQPDESATDSTSANSPDTAKEPASTGGAPAHPTGADAHGTISTPDPGNTRQAPADDPVDARASTPALQQPPQPSQPRRLLNRQHHRLELIKLKIHEIIPCLEEKMHVTLVAKDLMAKHMARIDGDYAVIVGNNEIPASVRVGPLNHPAMTNEAPAPASATGGRLETRREALAARKAATDGALGLDTADDKKKRPDFRPGTPQALKKRRRRDDDDDDLAPKPPGLEPTYCFCNQVSFGKMVGCDGDDCKREWFHLLCIGFTHPPKGKWYCDECVAKKTKNRRV